MINKFVSALIFLVFFLVIQPKANANCNTEGCDAVLNAQEGKTYMSSSDPAPSFGILGSSVWGFLIEKGKGGNDFKLYMCDTKPQTWKLGKMYFAKCNTTQKVK